VKIWNDLPSDADFTSIGAFRGTFARFNLLVYCDHDYYFFRSGLSFIFSFYRTLKAPDKGLVLQLPARQSDVISLLHVYIIS